MTARKSESKEAVVVYNTELIPLDKTESLTICKVVGDQVNLLTRRTPIKFLKNRVGRGGKVFTYVDVHYITAILNAVFFGAWDFEILEHEVDKQEGQVVVKGRLTVTFVGGKKVIKEAFGSSEIKRTKSGDMLDKADDLKGASSDALKKAASMLGIAHDVYSGQVKAEPEATDTEEADDFLDDNKDKFKSITLQLANGRSVQVDKFEALGYFGKVKDVLGEEIYRATLKLSGFNKSNEIPPEQIPAMYKILVDAFRSRKAPQAEEKHEKPNE